MGFWLSETITWKIKLSVDADVEANYREIGKRSRGEVEKKTEFNFTMRGKKEQVATGLLAIQKHLLALKITLP